MKYIIKASLFKVLSSLPNADSLHYFLQKKVTKSLPCSDEYFLKKVAVAKKHFEVFLNQCPVSKISDAQLFEFGAGWDLIVPLSYYSMGIQHQTVIDIRQNMKLELVNDTISKFVMHKSKLEKDLKMELKVNFRNVHECADLKNFGINFLAPVDAKNTHFSEKKI